MEKNNHSAADNIPRISSQSEQNEQLEFGSQPDYGGTLFDDTIFQNNHLQGIPLPHIFGRGSRQDAARSSQPHNLGLMGDGDNVVGNLSLNYGAEPDPQCILNAESICPSPVGNITTNFQSCDYRTTTSSSIATSNLLQSSRPQGPQIGSSLGSIEGSVNARFWSYDNQRLIFHPDRLPSLQRNTLQSSQLDRSILSLGIKTTEGDPFDGHAGTAMSGNTVMAKAMLSNRLSGPLIDESFLTTGHGGDCDVGFQVNDYSGSGRFLSMQGNMGARNLPRNHGRLMGITNYWTMLCIAAQSDSGFSRAPTEWTSSQHVLDGSTTSSEQSHDQNYIRWRPDDNQSSGFRTGEKCYICKRDVGYMPTGTMSRSSGTIPTAVLACKQVFHEECLLSITPREQATDPLFHG